MFRANLCHLAVFLTVTIPALSQDTLTTVGHSTRTASGSLCGRVLSDDSVPVAAAHLEIARPDNAGPFWMGPSAWSNSDGKFCLEGIDPGSHDVIASKPGWVPAKQHAYVRASDRMQAGDIVLAHAVAELWNPSLIRFQGNKTFPDAVIRKALIQDPDFLVAAHPLAPLREYASVIQRRVRAGYLEMGFHEAKIVAALNIPGDGVTVSVVEGPRYMQGEIQIVGGKRISKARLRRALTHSLLSSGFEGTALAITPELQAAIQRRMLHAAWSSGEPASFSPTKNDEVQGDVEQIVAGLGYWFPRIRAEVVPDEKTHTATLLVRLDDEGKEETIGEIVVEGNKRNSSYEIERAAGLVRGMKLTQNALKEAKERLDASGRFLATDTAVEPIHESKNALLVHVKVDERKRARRLSEALTPEEQAVMRLCDRLNSAAQRGEDLRIEVSSDAQKNALVLVASEKGLILTSQKASGQWEHAFLLAHDRVALYTPALESYLTTSATTPNVWAELVLSAGKDNDKEQHQLGFKFGWMQKTGDFGFRIMATPAACLNLVDVEDSSSKTEGGVLTINQSKSDGNMGEILAVASTGELRSWRYRSHSPDLAVTVSLEKGAFDGTRKLLEALPRMNGGAAPLSVWMGKGARVMLEDPGLDSFLSYELPRLRSREQREAGARAVDKLVAASIAPFDPWLSTDANEVEFSIPIDPASMGNRPAGPAAAFVYAHTHELFPKDSWPWTVLHEAVYVSSDNTLYTGQELQRLYDSDEIGPFGFLVVAEALQRIESPYAVKFAERGLTRLTKEEFRKDVVAVAQPEGRLGQAIENSAAVLRDLTPDEMAGLLHLLPEGVQSTLLEYQKNLLHSPSATAARQIVSPLLEREWEAHIRPWLETRLQAIMATPVEPATVAAQ